MVVVHELSLAVSPTVDSVWKMSPVCLCARQKE